MSPMNHIEREDFGKESIEQRLRHYREFVRPSAEGVIEKQSSRCLDCGVPFCQGPKGCPVKNLIPDWNELVKNGDWKTAYQKLESTNNFPEFTGKLCPAPCESVCVKGLHDDAVSIKNIELSIIEKAFAENWVQPKIAPIRTGRRVAIVGSGPAGLAAAQQLARKGHDVTVYEKASHPGGLLRFGIPDFKLEKKYIDRRIYQLEQEGVQFRTNMEVGKDITLEALMVENDAVALTIGAEKPRDLAVPGRELKGVHFAMDFLSRQNKINAGLWQTEPEPSLLSAKGKKVVIIGGGDTGADCYGTALRQGCLKVYQLEILPKPTKYKVSTSHEEGVLRGGERRWSTSTIEIIGNEQGAVKAIKTQDILWNEGQPTTVLGTEKLIEADLVLLAMGFTGVELGAFSKTEVLINQRGSISTEPGKFSAGLPRLYAAGDAKRGASLIVWAIAEGREMAEEIHGKMAPLK